jgi:hypothetical protein
MPTLTVVPVIPLDTISRNLSHINERLSDIEDKVVLDDWFKVLIIAMPVLVGILTFFLTRNKDFRMKKAEIGGEIFMRMEELKQLRLEYKFSFSSYMAYDATIRLEGQQDNQDQQLKDLYGFERLKSPDAIQNRVREISKELSKFVGQYRYYLQRKDGKQLRDISFAVSLHHIRYELYEDCKTRQEIFDKHEKILLEEILVDNKQEKQFTELCEKLELLLVK